MWHTLGNRFFRRCKEREGGGRGGGRPFRKEKENGRERDGRGPERPLPEGWYVGERGVRGGRGHAAWPPDIRRQAERFCILTVKTPR